MNTQELYTQIESLFEQFKAEQAKPTKVAHREARKILGEVKKLISPYNQASVNEDKAKKG